MFEEFAILNRSRWMLLAGIIYTVWTLVGVLWRGWSIGEVFFWMWWEIVLSGISATLLIHRWRRMLGGAAHEPFRAALGVALAVGLMLVFASMFTLLALASDKVAFRDLGSYLHSRLSTLTMLAALTTALHLMVSRSRNFPAMTRLQIESPLTGRMMSMLGVYAVMIFFYHWSGQSKLELNQTNQMVMGLALLGTKLALELRQWFKSAALFSDERKTRLPHELFDLDG